MTTEHQAWLALTAEDAIAPDLPICDPHHHFWDRPSNRYILEDLLGDTGSGHNITETVFVECSSEYLKEGPEALKPVGETVFVQGIADESAARNDRTEVAAGIVSSADFTLGDAVTEVLEAHLKASPNRFRGIRHRAAWDPNINASSTGAPPEGILLDAKFREGYARMEPMNLSFEAWVYHPQIPEVADLARAFPNISIILNHIGGPIVIGPYKGRRNEVLETWEQSMADLATCPNVFVKVGGLGMTFTGYDWHERDQPIGSEELAEAMRPYYLYCVEKFGADRCMYESNFPVDKASYSYNVMWNAFKRISEGFSDSEKASLFRGTAKRAYRLGAFA
ncbi:MAG: amidohydrolase family protein [SAR202 cluster bacterium]|jgi:predicted TIM-barrel fold metal-dependent hydrolase|nr:amidohydrolase family protein [SAR202 cluster bacterium]MDP7105260.1 amidohydrolase family protein [SAR202 cluster bacterium]MDP7226839.1 amidohydrolase family protein [SAR202 cluster bacterium]MDP7413113.1 amidohydrolase family protein [SAR202 cluster bacterium]HJO83140.1 amidohydrolase family protein [SAR202 cluster bacterium]|tara:strand:+ start:3659 stop:4669 length:1011 start_codon:yes stop_codon:yes gene_type:complete